MGVVFHPERLATGNIPADANGQSQYDAAMLLGESLHEQAAQQPDNGTALVAYMLYGSAERPYERVATRRSDVDLLVIIDEDAEPSTAREAVTDRIVAISQALHVDVGATIYNRADFTNGMRVNPFYAQHLSSVYGLVHNPTLQYFSPVFYSAGLAESLFGNVPFVDSWPFATKYLEARRAVFQTQLDQIEPDLTQLKGPFELPRNLGRTIADLFDQYICEHTDSYSPGLDDVSSPVDRSLPHWLKLLKIAELTGTSDLIGTDVERLHELDTTYTDLLETAIRGDISIQRYEAWLRNVYTEALEKAFKIVDMADALVHRTVELAQVDTSYDQVEFDEDFLAGWYDSSEFRRDLQEKIHRAGQITPITYDVDQLMFTIAPKYPDIAERYKLGPRERRLAREGPNDLEMKFAWLRSRAAMQAR